MNSPHLACTEDESPIGLLLIPRTSSLSTYQILVRETQAERDREGDMERDKDRERDRDREREVSYANRDG